MSLKPVRIGSFNKLFGYYKKNARVHLRKFTLTKNAFEKLIYADCFYCGQKPTRQFKSGKTTICYNGIDRKNNSRGYTVVNSVTCCWTCNQMKSSKNIKEFAEHIVKISTNLLKQIKL